MIKVCLTPFGVTSPSMFRIAHALGTRAPKGVQIVVDASTADVQLLHTIGFDAKEKLRTKEYIVAQYCGSLCADDSRWQELWQGARFVWSYYDLAKHMPRGSRFVHTPLGLDNAFVKSAMRAEEADRSLLVMTSGRVTNEAAEAIQEVAMAVDRVKGQMVHLGPTVIEGWEGEYPSCWQAQEGISDQGLTQLYEECQFVSGLRHGEGFEMPVIEGLACGARPIVFERPDMRMWYDGIAEFVPECHGEELTDRIVHVFKNSAMGPVNSTLRRWVVEQFSWDAIAAEFWNAFIATRPIQVQVSGGKRRVLIIGDAGVSTGFAKGTHAAADALNVPYEVHVIALNHNGDPYPSAYPLYPAGAGGDPLGYGRVREKVTELGPAAILIQNDPWNFPDYMKHVGNVKTLGWVAVDGKNINGTKLAGLLKAIFWTEFGASEARKGGWDGPSAVVPLGVDLNAFNPMSIEERATLRETTCGELFRERGVPLDTFIVGSIGRNQLRKRLDLTIQYFSEWVQMKKVTNAMLWLQSAPTGDYAFDLADLCKYFGIADRVIAPQVNSRHGMSEQALRKVYNMFDVLFVTSLGEGFHLPSFEAMACGTPVIAPDWSALGELLAGNQMLVPCTAIAAHPRSSNTTIGGVMDRQGAIEALDLLYNDYARRREFGQNGMNFTAQDRFRWENVGAAIVREVAEVLGDSAVQLPKEQPALVTA